MVSRSDHSYLGRPNFGFNSEIDQLFDHFPLPLLLTLQRLTHLDLPYHLTPIVPKMAAALRTTLKLGMIPADGIGKEVIPVSWRISGSEVKRSEDGTR
jgi:hypothetical protein